MSKKKKKKKGNAVSAKNLPIQTNKKPKKKKEKQIPEEKKVEEIKVSEETETVEETIAPEEQEVETEIVEETETEVQEEPVEDPEPEVEEEIPAEETVEEIPEQEIAEQPVEEPTSEEITPFEIREASDYDEPTVHAVPGVEPFIPVEPSEPEEDDLVYETVPVTPVVPIAASQPAPSVNRPARVPNNIDVILEKNRLEQEKLDKENKKKNVFRNILIFLLVALIVSLIGFMIFMIIKDGKKVIHVKSTTTITTTAPKTRLISFKTSTTASRGIITIATTTTTIKPDRTVYRIEPATNNPEKSGEVVYSRTTTTTKAQIKYTYEATYDDATTLYKVRIYKNGALMNPNNKSVPILVKSSGTEIASTKTSTASIPYAIAGKLKSCGSLTVFDPDDGKDHTMTASKCTPQ